MSASITVKLEDGRLRTLHVTSCTLVGTIVEQLALSQSNNPNMSDCELRYKGSALPLNMRVCAVPPNVILEFKMAYQRAVTTAWFRPSCSSRSVATDSLTSQPSAVVQRSHRFIRVEVPQVGTTCVVVRRESVVETEPVLSLRCALAVPEGLCMHYRGKPLVDENKSFVELDITDAHVISFAEFVVRSEQNGAALRSMLDVTQRREDVEQQGTAINSPLNSLYKKRMVAHTGGNEKEVSVVNRSQTSASSRLTTRNLLSSSSFQVDPDVSSRPHVQATQGPVADRANTSVIVTTVSGSPRHVPPPRQSSPHRRIHRDQSHITIFLHDPEDDGFTHEIRVLGDRSVESLLEFFETSHPYQIFCDGLQVKDLSDTFRQCTGGNDGSVFTLV